jgi:hypothetical protein
MRPLIGFQYIRVKSFEEAWETMERYPQEYRLLAGGTALSGESKWIKDKSTGAGAFELLVNRYTGYVTPEPGPNMMWNTKYGAMSGMMWGVNTAGPMTVTEGQAKKDAQDVLE